jgi:hypothetical protein
MIDAGSIEYAHARLWARHGRRPGEAAWRTIGMVRGLPALLDTARGLPFLPWIAGIAPDADPHAIEARLLAHWRTLVAEVQSWMPSAWQPAVAWAGALADLPVVQHLARGGATLPWMRGDAVYRSFCGDPAGAPSAGPLAPIAAVWSQPDTFAAAWRVEWLRRIPRGAFVDAGIVDACARAIGAERAALADPSLVDGAARRRALAARLSLLFRRAALDPAAAFIFLALSALDAERLRGELLLRAIFPRLVQPA